MPTYQLPNSMNSWHCRLDEHDGDWATVTIEEGPDTGAALVIPYSLLTVTNDPPPQGDLRYDLGAERLPARWDSVQTDRAVIVAPARFGGFTFQVVQGEQHGRIAVLDEDTSIAVAWTILRHIATKRGTPL